MGWIRVRTICSLIRLSSSRRVAWYSSGRVGVIGVIVVIGGIGVIGVTGVIWVIGVVGVIGYYSGGQGHDYYRPHWG